MKVIALINRAAGSMHADSASRLRSVLQTAGVTDPEIEVFDRRRGLAHVQQLAARKPDFLVVLGGDGTHRTALNAVGMSPANLVLLPGGTRNLLSRSLHGSSPWTEILPRVLSGFSRKTLPAGRVDGELFFCALLAGAPAVLADSWQRLRTGEFAAAVGDVGRGLWAVEHMRLHVRVEAEDAPALPTTSFVGALVGSLAGSPRMEVLAMNKPGIYPGLDAIWTSFQSGFRELHDISIVPADAFSVSNEEAESIPTIVDGEHIDLGAEYLVTHEKLGATCLVAG